MIKPELEFLHTNEELWQDAVRDYAKATRKMIERLHRYWNRDEKELYKELIKEGRIIGFLDIILDDYHYDNCNDTY